MKMTTVTRSSRFVVQAATLVAAFVCTDAQLAWAANPNQVVNPNPAAINASSGSNVQFSLMYTTDESPPNQSLTGLGVRMYWDSNKLDFSGTASELGTGLLSKDTLCQSDVNDNGDGDTATDCYVNIAWFSSGGGWPGVALPVALYQANFVSKLATGDHTNINFTSSGGVGTAVGYGFLGTSVVVSDGPVASPTTPPPPCGDANSNGSVTAGDALVVKRYKAGLITSSQINLVAADVSVPPNGVTAGDALMILRFKAGLSVTGTCLGQ